MTEPADRAWSVMRALVLDHDRRKEVAHALGLSFIRARALVKLAGGPLPMGTLADRLGTDPPHASVIVRDLEARGLVSRAPQADDRRVRLVSLTDAGRAAARRARQILEAPPPALAALPEDDLRELERILASVTAPA